MRNERRRLGRRALKKFNRCKTPLNIHMSSVESLLRGTGVTIIVGTEKGLTDEERNAVMAAAEELDKKLNCD